MRFRRVSVFAALVVLAALVAAGCGGKKKTETEGPKPAAVTAAAFVPAGVAGFITINTDTEGGQWQAAEAILDKFPGKETLLAAIRKGLDTEGVDFENDVLPALGSEATLVFLDFENGGDDLVGVLQPKDPEKFKALVEKGEGPSVLEEVDGWTVFADTQELIDRFKDLRSGGSLADDAGFQAASERFGGDSLVTVYIDGAKAQAGLEESPLGALGGTDLQWIAVSLRALEGGVLLTGAVKSEGGPDAGASIQQKFLDQFPSGALVYLGFSGLGKAVDTLKENEAVQQFLPTVEGFLGVSIDDLAALFSGETAAAVYQGTPFPAVTVVTEPEDTASALQTLDRIAARVGAALGFGPVRESTAGGVAGKELQFGPITVYWAALDGSVAATTSPRGISDLRDTGEKLADDPVFQEAKAAAGLPDEAGVVLYINLKDSLPAIEAFASIAGQKLPEVVSENLRPLRSFLAFGSQEGGEATFAAFLAVG